MSVKTTVIIDDKEINVLWFDFSYQRHADASGKPTTPAVFLGITLAIETRKDLNLADWAFAANQTKEIEIHIAPIILGGSTRIIKLFDCHLLNWHNNFSSEGTAPMHEVLHISAAGVKDTNSSAEYSAYWRTTFEHNDTPISYNDLQEEPELTACYFTDIDGNELEEYETGDKVVLNIETENSVGENISINLNDKSHDFKYNGTVLENDTIKVSIGSDLEKIELEVIAQEQ